MTDRPSRPDEDGPTLDDDDSADVDAEGADRASPVPDASSQEPASASTESGPSAARSMRSRPGTLRAPSLRASLPPAGPERTRLVRRVVRGLAALGVVIAVLTFRVVNSSSTELNSGDMLRDRGDTVASVAHYRRAARWYAPGNPYSTTALERLDELATAAEEHGDPELALSAHRSIRAAILSTRSVYVPHRERLERADENIARLMAAGPRPAIDAGRTDAEVRADHLRLLRESPAQPALGWSLVALLGLLAWIGAAFGFLTRGIDEEDRVVPSAARAWGTVLVLGLGLFVLGLSLA